MEKVTRNIMALGVTEEDRSVVLEEKDGVITIKKNKY